MKAQWMQAKYRPLVIGAAVLVLLPLAMPALGLGTNTASQVVCFAIAALGLNMLVGFTGLHSFGHSAWFGIGAYAAAIAQKQWFEGQIGLPLLFSMVVVAALSTAVGLLILRRRGVYFALLTLAFVALTYNIAFRWTALTGGEDGLGGLQRGGFGPIHMDDSGVYYAFVALVALGVLYVLLRVTRSPFGHVLVAIRENQQRATFQGYNVDRYRLGVFVLSAVVTGLGGALLGFLNYLVSAEAVSVELSGELLAMVVIGGMHHILGPALGVLFYILFRELFSIWTDNWLLWFGLIFVGFVIYSPSGLAGIWAKLQRRWWPPPEESAAMSARAIRAGVPLPAFLRSGARQGTVLEVDSVSKNFGGIRAVADASLAIESGEIHALIGPNGAGKTTVFNLVSGLFAPDTGRIRLEGREIESLPPYRICRQGIARSFQITNLFKGLSIYENLRLSLQAQHPARFNFWRDIDSYPEIHAETAELISFLGLEGIEPIQGGELSYGGQRLLDMGIALGSKPQMLLLDEPLAGLAAAERERVSNLIMSVGASIPVLIVEHDIDRVLGFSQNVTVMNQGEVLMTGKPDAVRSDARVQQIYTGTGTPPVTGKMAVETRERASLLRFERVNAFYGKSHILTDATLDVAGGRDRGASRPQRCGQVHASQDAWRIGAGGVGHDRVRRPGHRDVAGAGHRAARDRICPAGARPLRRNDGRRQPGARPPGARHGRAQRRRLERAEDLRILPALAGAHAHRGGLPVGRRAADGGGGARAVGQRPAAASGRAVRGACADCDPGALHGLRPSARPGLHPDRRAQPGSRARARGSRVRARARCGLPRGPRGAAVERPGLPQADPLAVTNIPETRRAPHERAN